MDHEFFTHQLEANESGWDWLSLQFDDHTELMLYRFRHEDGSVDPFSAGTYVDGQGKSTFLGVSDFSMQPEGETYASPNTHAVYPTAWRVTVPSLALDLQMKTPLRSQELVSGYSTRPFLLGRSDHCQWNSQWCAGNGRRVSGDDGLRPSR